MFFKNYLISVADRLQNQYEGQKRKGQNPADIGELCEIFIKEFLTDCFSAHFNIFRGGKIVNIENKESNQMDIVITSKNSIKIFTDKGIYPIESVFGVFSITSSLSYNKLLGCINEFNSIPKNNPRFLYQGNDMPPSVLSEWERHFPYKCIFSFSGDMNKNWETNLCNMVKENKFSKVNLPDIIIVNKKGVMGKIGENYKYHPTGEVIEKDFHYTDYSQENYHTGFSYILNKLFILSQWQYHLVPKYLDYFNKDLNF